MNTLELYTNNKTFYPSIEKDGLIHLSNTIMEQISDNDYDFFLRRLSFSSKENMVLKQNKDLYKIESWMVRKISPEGVDIQIGSKNLISHE